MKDKYALRDVKGLHVAVGDKVYDLSTEKFVKDYGEPDTIVKIYGNSVTLSTGKVVRRKGIGCLLPIARVEGE